jgi:ribosomal protein L30E
LEFVIWDLEFKTRCETMTDIKKLVKEETIVYGTEQAFKHLKKGDATKVLISSNCPEDLKVQITQLAEIAKAEVEQLDIPNDELGVVCKKQFAISVLAVLKK